MGDNPPRVTRRFILAVSSLGITTISGCLGWLGLGGDSDSGSGSDGSSSDSSSNSGDGDTDTTQRGPQNESDAPAAENETPTQNDSGNDSSPQNESENQSEAAVPESNPENDPSGMEPADPNETGSLPSQEDLNLKESYYDKQNNEAVIVVTNTSNRRIRSVDFQVTFYDGSGTTVGKNMDGATGVGPGQEATVRVACKAGHASTFKITRVYVS